MTTREIAKREPSALTVAMPAEMSIEELVARTRKVQEAMAAVMKDGEHYGTIPGTNKPTLLKPGAEKLLNLFMLDPEYDVMPTREGDHLDLMSRCTLYHIPTGTRVGSGMGSCSTRESKYAYRNAKRACPTCGAEAINRSKYPPRGQAQVPPGWYCYAKAGGCNATFAHDDVAIIGQTLGRVDNPDKADQYNTVLKMANKRSLVAAILNVTAASDIFTQDLEDLPPAPERPVVDPTPAPPPETVDEEALRLFPSEPVEDAQMLLTRIDAGFRKLGMGLPARADAWRKHCGEAVIMDPVVDVAALAALLADLRARAKAAR